MQRVAILVLIAVALFWPVQIMAVDDQKEPSKESSKKQPTIEQRATFNPAERNLIRAQLLGQRRASSQQKQKKLPPGLQKKIAIGESLDYHVYRQGERLPETITQRLPKPPKGTGIIIVEDRVIRINESTRTILDFFNLTPTR